MGSSAGLPPVVGTAAWVARAGPTVADADAVTAETVVDGNGEPLDEHADRNNSKATEFSARFMGEDYA